MFDQRRRGRTRRFYLLLAVVALLVLSVRFIAGTRQPAMISPLPDNPDITQKPKQEKRGSFTLFAKKKSPDELNNRINSVVGDAWNDYSIVVEDYSSDFALKTSEGEIFVAASVNKVPILAVLYSLADKGEIDLDRDITLQAADIQDYGTGSIRYAKTGTVYSVKTLAKLMIKQSDNTAAYILANHIIGFDKLKTVLAGWGLVQTDMIDNKTSNQDIARIFRMIYEGKIAGTALTQEMLSFLKDTDFETRLPASLPDSATTYHKIGTEVGVIHDAGIVTDGSHTYYIGVFTNGTAESEETDKLIAAVSKTVHEYMTH